MCVHSYFNSLFLVLLLSACGDSDLKRSKKANNTKPDVLHIKNVDITLDSTFWKRIDKHRYDEFACVKAKQKFGLGENHIKNIEIGYLGCAFSDEKAFLASDSIIRATLQLERLFGYKEKGVLYNVGGWSTNWDNHNSAFSYLHPEVNANILCYRSYEKLQGVWQIMERFYIFSHKDNHVKDVIACNLHPKDSETVYVMPLGALGPEWEKLRATKHTKTNIFYYYRHYNPKEISRGGYKMHYPASLALNGTTIVGTGSAILNSEGNISISQAMIGAKD